MNQEEINKQIRETEDRGEQIVKYLDKYKGQPIYNEIALAIEFGYQIRLAEEEKEPELYTHEQLENHIRNAMRFKGYTSEYEVQEYCKKYLN